MKTITNNPYRILGILSGATLKEETRQANKLKRYIAAEEELPVDYSFSAIDNFQRTVESIDDAVERNDTDPEKIENCLFWFWRGNEITDEPAFDALKEGNVTDAIKIWQKLIINDKITAKNASSYHNLSVYELWKGNKVTGIKYKLKLLDSDFCRLLKTACVDATYTINKKDWQQLFLRQISTEIEVSKVVEAIADIDFSAKADFLKNISKSFIDNIKAQIDTAAKKCNDNNANAAKAGEDLVDNTKNDLAQLKSILGASDFNYANIADKVANELLQCSIDYFNYMQEHDSDTDYHACATKLVKLAQSVAVGSIVKGRAKENLDTMEQMKDKEIHNAISALQMIKDAYEQACGQIDAQVRQQSLNLDWNQSINWNKVDEIKRNAIDWDKVNDVLKDTLSDKNIEKIKICTNDAQKQKIIELAEWVKSHSTSKSVIKHIINQFYGKSENSKEVTAIKNKYAWYNNPKDWDDFSDWIPKGCLSAGILSLPIILVYVILVIIYAIYRLIAIIVKSINS
jgi:hypothetical protein